MVLYAKDILAKDFLSISKDSSVLEGARAMKASKHGFAVVGSPASPEGIVTEWDVLSKVVAEGRDPDKVRLYEIMTSELVSVKSTEGIATVAKIMSERGVRRMLVKDGDQVIGYITEKTVLANLEDYVDRVSAQISRLQAPWF